MPGRPIMNAYRTHGGQVHYYAVLVDDERAGEAQLHTSPGNRTAEMWAFQVYPRFRRRGVAAVLITRLLHEARCWGLTAVQLWVHADDTAARAFYARHGFIEADQNERGVLMVCSFA
jgi:GNAT superfamily N-acetyltransferase